MADLLQELESRRYVTPFEGRCFTCGRSYDGGDEVGILPADVRPSCGECVYDARKLLGGSS